MQGHPADKKLRWMASDAVITVESKRTNIWGMYVIAVSAGLLIDAGTANSMHAASVVVRDRGSGRVVYRDGPYPGRKLAVEAARGVRESIARCGLPQFLHEMGANGLKCSIPASQRQTEQSPTD
jgi:DNA primase